ncbi:MAG: sulfatase-like hydrolase/transferase [Acidobacteria bacterium]|nr:sulfatase-like hydrolase/transferase [Acidobacteriota bacterium]
MMRLLVLFVGLAMLATPARAADRNVVFFVADDHGTEALGAYGNRVVKTPSLDQLALEGVRFTHAFATTASAARAAIPSSPRISRPTRNTRTSWRTSKPGSKHFRSAREIPGSSNGDTSSRTLQFSDHVALEPLYARHLRRSARVRPPGPRVAHRPRLPPRHAGAGESGSRSGSGAGTAGSEAQRAGHLR